VPPVERPLPSPGLTNITCIGIGHADAKNTGRSILYVGVAAGKKAREEQEENFCSFFFFFFAFFKQTKQVPRCLTMRRT
jgi:hypothetical protein